MAWALVMTVCDGGPNALNALNGRRVRTKIPITTGLIEGAEQMVGDKRITLPVKSEGFVGVPVEDGVVLGFPKNPQAKPCRMELMADGSFNSVLVGHHDFRVGFEVEI